MCIKEDRKEVNFGISIKIHLKHYPNIPWIIKKLSKKILELIFFCLFLPSKLTKKDDLEGKKRQNKMNYEIVFDNLFIIQVMLG